MQSWPSGQIAIIGLWVVGLGVGIIVAYGSMYNCKDESHARVHCLANHEHDIGVSRCDGHCAYQRFVCENDINEHEHAIGVRVTRVYMYVL